MQRMIEFPTAFWVSQYTIRFAFQEEISAENSRNVRLFRTFLQQALSADLLEVVASYATVTAYVKRKVALQPLREQWYAQQASIEVSVSHTPIQIPLCYDEEFALDMQRVMDYTGLAYEQIKQLHLAKVYRVYVIGFLPGFPYLGELAEALFVPRLAKPRQRVAASSVGIGGAQTGIYPLDSPGGWNIIGKTPLKLFQMQRAQPFLLDVGDCIQFYEITKAEFRQMEVNSY
ncbi:5-oxoprolinase subunit PxpB [Lysinibacillus piscis]|uniref:Allophanate hydrolase n=1 Tax=Lysinibacillus piscis TaxID=2518931 RepID=A0ABQ5NEY6_9BACI|nr:5-oxoprolinase subunit PxpB [Lysinibacillus sp. KH24]GLC86949.1 allophanate hydrolase [Lysinibacillus sp. KH24]